MENKTKRVTKPKSDLVVMIRDDGKQANVHVSEVENYKLGGYKVKEG